ncbi:pfs domain-containing protein [Trichoderma harzianum]|uniref:Pfs domain-containing protein n=1 Tax=Trichoderma harzianum TaxID=5544 RepID=A0A0G0A1W5_TRIHA|nr:pfs domain-containing protein [Trichoderma harzianum]
MPSNTSIRIHGSGPQNISSGDGPQYNNNSNGIQINSGNFVGFNPFRELKELERLPVENRGGMPSDDQPRSREDFHDEDGDSYGRAHGDTNTYTTGQIGKHNVVLALLPNMGTASAAGAAANFRSSYSAVKLTLLVGICGGVPGTGADEILLGDVVISKTVIQHTLGRQYPNEFVTKNTVYDSLGRPNKNVRTLIASFETERGRRQLRQKTGQYLRDLQSAALKERHRCSYQYPGVGEDKLFAADYRHKHRASQKCKCNQETDGLCEEAAQALCSTLMCDEGQLVLRQRLVMKKDLELDDAQCPEIFVGCVASGDTVMKSGEHRDRIARRRDIIAFEMEGAGIWNEVPCVIVKGVCDYADSHKNKVFQPFAAATAASVMKAMLGRYTLTESSSSHPRVAVPNSYVR